MRQKITITSVAVGILLAGLLLKATPLCATEVSGKIIKQLVEEVDREMSRLESRVAEFAHSSEELTEGLRTKFTRFKATTDEIAQQKLLADMLVDCARLNDEDLRQIAAYQETLTTLVSKMVRLKAEIRKLGTMGFRHEAEFLRFRHRMGTMMTNAVRILKKLRELKVDERVEQELIPIENTLVGVFKMFSSPLRPGPASYAQVEFSIRSMETTVAQLSCVKKLLEQERLRLKVDNLNQLSRLALLRLFKGRLNIGAVSELPTKMIDAVVERTELYSKAAGIAYRGEGGAGGSPTHSPSTQGILNKIGAGNLFKE